MQDTDIKSTADELLKDVDFSKIFEHENEDEDQVNFWIPVEYKARYQEIQALSKKKFSKLVKEMIMKCIDRASEMHKRAA